MSRLDVVLEQMVAARKYTTSLLDSLAPEEWFFMTPGEVTHVAWQVGHLAAAQYHLMLLRRRGPQPGDEELIPQSFRQLFGRGSVADPDPEAYPSPEEIRRVLDAVHTRALEELRAQGDEGLDEPTEPAHPMFTTKFGAIRFCPLHEMVHAGQIGLIRRLMGKSPLR